MKKRFIFILVALLLLAPWPVAYAYDNAGVGIEMYPMQVEIAEADTAPKLNGYGNAIGSVSPGDLFYIDSGDNNADIPVTLHIVNIDELVRCYRYLTLNVGIYGQTDEGQWQEITASNGAPLPETYVTMQNGQASLTLPGYARYKITIDKGCFYYYGDSDGEGAVAPEFYLTVG